MHDLHVWNITSGMDALSTHSVLKEGISLEDRQKILGAMNAQLKEKFGITHTTV